MRHGKAVPSGLDESDGAEVDTPTFIGQEEAQMILIPAGEYIMGSTEGEGYNDENPQIRCFWTLSISTGVKYPTRSTSSSWMQPDTERRCIGTMENITIRGNR